ncbi:MAG: CCA tRNA nucleotidyltransferase [Solirubrobacterales bacterium]
MAADDAVERLLSAGAVARLQEAVEAAGDDGSGAWIVGGAVRDALLGHEVTDVDLVVSGDPEMLTRAIAGHLDGIAFELSDEFDTWRAQGRSLDWQVDVTALRGSTIEADLEHRDFTVGSIAVPIGGGSLVDPLGGLGDIQDGVLRAVSDRALTDDPLRVMRAARLSSQFGWEIDPETLGLARAAAPQLDSVAGERVLSEFLLLVGSRDPLRGVDALDRVGAMAAVLPELAGLKGVIQGPNHHLDVYGHTIEVLEGVLRIETELDRFVGDSAARTSELLSEPLADGIDRAVGLRLGALFHDCAKPETRTERDGFVGFRGHDEVGASKVTEMFARLRGSRRLAGHVADLTRHHLILGFMAAGEPPTPDQIYRYLKETSPVSVDVTLLTVADRLAARGTGPVASTEMVEAHLELASRMVAEGLTWRENGPPRLPISGDQLAREIGIEEGPELGQLIERLEGAVWTGEVESASDAVALAREIVQDG